jgi:hypothetical protein
VEFPFSLRAVGEIRDAVEWIHGKVDLEEDSEYPDGSDPYYIRQKWEPWIIECIELFLDADGAFRRFRYDLSIDEYPWVDIQIYRIIRAKYVDLKNEDMKREMSGSGKKRY